MYVTVYDKIQSCFDNHNKQELEQMKIVIDKHISDISLQKIKM